MPDDALFSQVLDPTSRPDPYPLYAQLRRRPVWRQHDGRYVVSSHATIRSLLFDPRLSSEDIPPSRRPHTGNPIRDWFLNPIKDRIVSDHRPFIFRDAPDHDALRTLVMEQFTVPRVRALTGRVEALVDRLVEGFRGRDEVCLVDDFSYPLPVAVICELLGVPREDEPRFQGWATQLATALEPDVRRDEATGRVNVATFDAISDYMRALIREKRRRPADDMLSGLARRRGPGLDAMGEFDLVATAILLLVAGHETTVNLITNGMLTLLRHPGELRRLRADPERAPRVVEEVLRYDPPVHFRTRKALSDIDVGDAVIPGGAPVVLLFAAGNRDPARFSDADRFDPDRADNQHFGFGGGLHYCVGAPLARIEAEIALVALCRRLIDPRPSIDPPPYRPGASLRGPENLRILIEGVT